MTPAMMLGAAGAALVGFSLVSGRKMVIGNSGPMMVKSVGNGGYLRPDAADAFNAMVDRARLDGVTLMAGSAFRSLLEQADLYLRWKAGTYNVPSVARPGTSNHGNGTAVDIASAPRVSLSYGSAGFQWMQSNGAAFGFSWDEGSKVNEPWHWRFVG